MSRGDCAIAQTLRNLRNSREAREQRDELHKMDASRRPRAIDDAAPSSHPPVHPFRACFIA